MAIIDFSLFKQHVRADDFAEDDKLLRHYLDSAEAYVINYTHRTAEELTEIGGGVFPLPLCQAVLLIGAHWYNQREAAGGVQMYEAPHTIKALLKPYRKLG